MQSGDDKKAAFKHALQHFLEVMGKNYDRNKNPRESKPGQLYVAYTGKWQPSFTNHNFPFYFADAVDMYERRKDEHQGETALLFDPNCEHIKRLRSVITDVKENTTSDSKPYKAAAEIEDALNQVQKNAYLPIFVKKPSIPLKISGFSGGVSVVREFGKNNPDPQLSHQFKGQAIMEMPSHCILSTVLEPNITSNYDSHKDNILDITAIDRDGRTRTFNWQACELDAGGQEQLLKIREELYGRLPTGDFMREIRRLPVNHPIITDERNQNYMDKFIDRLVAAFPSRVNIGMQNAERSV